MKRIVLVVLAFVTAAYLFGCKKNQVTEGPVSMEQVETTVGENITPAQPETPVAPVINASVNPAQSEPLLPQGPFKPTAQQIQIALKNFGYYAGIIDGKIGPLAKKAIVEFQKANALEPDGKVGPKTWEILGKQLTNTLSVQPQAQVNKAPSLKKR